MENRNPAIQAILDQMIEQEPTLVGLLAGADHPYSCRCAQCLQYWVGVGPEEEGPDEWGFGPFTREEFEAAGGIVPALPPCEYYAEVEDGS